MKDEKMDQIGITNKNLIYNNFMGQDYLSSMGKDGTLNLSRFPKFKPINRR